MRIFISVATVLAILLVFSPVSAKSEKAQNESQTKVKNTVVEKNQNAASNTNKGTTNNREEEQNREDENNALKVKTGSKYLNNSKVKIEEAMVEVSSEEIQEELEVIEEEQEDSEGNIQNAMQKMEGRPGILKLIMGPDYKNAGQVRSEIVQLRNQIRKLNRIREKVPASDQPALDDAIDSLESDLTAIQADLNEKLSGFSLFGWLAKFLNGYVAPEPEASPSPESSPSASPSASVQPSQSPTPAATVEPTEAPTSEPTATATPVE